jgi:polysaccharide pyruvyl transferase CsaB
VGAGGAKPRVAALGYYGFNNLGDEAVLAGIWPALGKVVGATEFLVLSNDPRATVQLHPGVSAANRWRWREVAAALKGTDLFVFGGGSLLQDATSARSIIWYALMALLARRRSRRVLWWAQGVGPLRTPMSRRLVRFIARQADAITVRDTASLALLKEIGVRRSIQEVADPAFVLDPVTEAATTAGANHAADAPILLALRSWKNDTALQSALAGGANDDSLLGRLVRDTGGAPLIKYPMHLPEDRRFVDDLLQGVGGMTARDGRSEHGGEAPAAVLGQFARARLVIAMRLHALIFAARCAVPFVAISYDPKVDALARAAGQDDALVPVQEISAARLENTIKSVLATRAERVARLEAFARTQNERAHLPAQIAAEWLR